MMQFKIIIWHVSFIIQQQTIPYKYAVYKR